MIGIEINLGDRLVCAEVVFCIPAQPAKYHMRLSCLLFAV
ncbi:hypothetical protein FDUTEX481_06030 [Tolypothrix sp. PCC 7601]|nr:hypothetical protein FDUTEX481_06030 [Tolypothrix sp. PCC 7601]